VTVWTTRRGGCGIEAILVFIVIVRYSTLPFSSIGTVQNGGWLEYVTYSSPVAAVGGGILEVD